MASLHESESEPFLSQVDRVRKEIRDKFSKSHQILNEKETALLSELDQLVTSYKGEGVREQIQELNLIKESMKSKVQRNENQEIVVKSAAMMDDRIRELEMNLETMKRVELEWDETLEERLSEIGRIKVIELLDYKKRGEPVLTACKHSSNVSTEAGVFASPTSISIHPQTNNIYICDYGNNRVQIFTSSFQFLFQFNKKMHGPRGICFNENKVYVAQAESNSLNVYSVEGKFLRSVGEEEGLKFDQPRGIEISVLKNLIYVCDNKNNRIQCLNFDLTFNSFILNIFGPRDIKLTQNEIVILKRGDHCICLFNYSHQFVREMIHCGEGTPLNRPQYFCLDQQNNILMTDISSHCVAIFSIRGELIYKFGKKGVKRGEFIEPRGIALDSFNKIIVLSMNPTNCMQLF